MTASNDSSLPANGTSQTTNDKPTTTDNSVPQNGDADPKASKLDAKDDCVEGSWTVESGMW